MALQVQVGTQAERLVLVLVQLLLLLGRGGVDALLCGVHGVVRGPPAP